MRTTPRTNSLWLAIVISSFTLLGVACADEGQPAAVRDLANVPEPQREILADGTVTEVEYERAVLAMLQCLADNGVQHTAPVWVQGRDRATLTFEMSSSGSDTVGVYDTCFVEYQREVEVAWVLQHAPSEVERQARRAVVVQCMNERGYPIVDLAQMDEYLKTAPESANRDATSCRTLGFLGYDALARNTAPTPDASAGTAPGAFVKLVPELATTWPQVSEYQRLMLADGDLTRAEYEASAQAVVQCLRDVGFRDVRDIHPDVTGKFLGYGISFGSTDVPSLKLEPDETPQQAIERCRVEFHDSVSLVYEAMFAPTPAELAAAETAVRACIAGFVAGEPGTYEFALALRDLGDDGVVRYVDCSDDYAREHGVLWRPPSYQGELPSVAPTRIPEDASAAARRAVGECLRAAGYSSVPDLPGPLDYNAVRAAGGVEAIGECLRQVGEEFNIPDYQG